MHTARHTSEMVLGWPTPDANICRLRIRASQSLGAGSTALRRGGGQRSGRWDSNGRRRQDVRADGPRGLAGDGNVSKDSSPAPFQGTMREVLYMHEQEPRVQPGTGEHLTRALSQSLLSLTLSFKSF